MTASTYQKRYPNARPETIRQKQKEDAKLSQLRLELKRKRRTWLQVIWDDILRGKRWSA